MKTTAVLTPSRPVAQHAARSRRRPPLRQLSTFLVAIAGIAVLLYPAAATWFTAQAQASVLDSYAGAAEQLPDEQITALRDAAIAYNDQLAPGLLRDPYSAATGADDEAEDYFRLLRVPGTDVMGELSIPEIGVDLPILHGTSNAALDRGAGHLFGSSLPVGGPGTHAVLTAHAGLPHASMLTRLSELHEGDRFEVTVLGETLTYEVDSLRIVRPDDISELTIIPGEDIVTLITCTPINVNTHRLLVRGVRVDPEQTTAQHVSAHGTPDFPWWLLLFITATTAVGILVFRRRAGPRA
ncbi:class C sortase [Microbacterium sp. NPDC055988]|uniref:class C sortase n=1 Tax=Microbacterium sp. NPDC055988 TaxID=3345671 RepID=UPI0035DD7A4A